MNKNTPQGKGIRTAVQAMIGTFVAFFTGLWAIDEVRLYTETFVREEGVALVLVVLGVVGVSAGLISFLQNKLGR